MKTFSELGVSDTYLKALEEIGILNPTEIQIQAIPFLIAKGKDFIGQAQTGTGKTAAFGLPILHAVNPDDSHIQALILSPTRELGQQIAKQLFKFTKYGSKKIFIESVYGGARIDNQISALRRPTHILVATPGRLVDLLEQKLLISHLSELLYWMRLMRCSAWVLKRNSIQFFVLLMANAIPGFFRPLCLLP